MRAATDPAPRGSGLLASGGAIGRRSPTVVCGMEDVAVAFDDQSIFRFLFRLSADAQRVPIQQFLRRLVTGLANHYVAATCSIYLNSSRGLLARAEATGELETLVQAHEGAIRELEERLVTRAFERGTRVSAQDLIDPEAECPAPVTGDAVLADWDVFAFPLNTSGGTRAVVVLFLDEGSRPLGETDMQALLALGEVLEVGAERSQRPDQP